MAQQADSSLDTPRSFDRAVSLPRVQRLPIGHRRYGESHIERLELVECLREAGMPIRHMQRHAGLTFTRGETIPELPALPHERRTTSVARVAELQPDLKQFAGKPACWGGKLGVAVRERTA
jgi:DNA-binding transcriptional MerR regulator